jgi:acyl-coenzyme A thioesterase PaaI-like protein
MTTIDLMAADARGLTHGGFYFGMADYAAMLAVNDPNVVLGAAETRFLKPVQTGDSLLAQATVIGEKGKKRIVEVSVSRGEEIVFDGTFTCFVLPTHVFDA